MSASVRVRLRVTGRVQGVGFRWFVKETARRLGLAGWVRNASDGSVELEAAGPADQVGRLRDAVGRGPDGARVEALHEQPAGDDELPNPFKVHR